MIKLSCLSEMLPQCCEIDAFPISLCSKKQQLSLKEFLPNCKSVIVLAHHVQHSLEWVWFPLESERNNVTCAADLHLKSECDKILAKLEAKGFVSSIISYPGRCGIQFKDLADKTGLGKIGDNFLFLHKQWGPWVHLRVLVTDAEITECLFTCEEVCIHCENCKTSCPAKAIKDDTLLGTECSKYQDMQDEDADMQGNYIFKCEECVRTCPIGNAPREIMIKYK